VKLTKSLIVESIASTNGYSLKKAKDIVETLLELMKRSLESGDDVMISGFGKFCVKHKKARIGRNPVKGTDMIITARKVVTFKCSGKLKDKINREIL